MTGSRSWYGSIDLFAEGSLQNFLDNRRKKMAEEVNSADEDYILNVSENQYTDYLVEKYQVELLIIDFEEIYATTDERMIPAERFASPVINVYPGKRYRKQVVTFHLPIHGDPQLLRLRPNPAVMWSEHMQVSDGELTFEIVAFEEKNPEPIRKRKDEVVRNLERQLGHSQANLKEYNEALKDSVLKALQARKGQILQRRDLAEQLDVPIRRREDVPKTFAVPSPEVIRKVVPKPTVPREGYTPHPTVSDEDYRHILGTLQELSRQIERVPETYSKFSEEGLRDVIWVHLTPRYSAETTGESFNKSGKTDILMRHEGTNLFVAECLIWDGSKHYLKKIDQLLSYLTWRDSKGAIVVFVKTKEFSRVMDAVESKTPEHPSFLRCVDRPDQSWWNYIFHLPEDGNLEVKLAVMLCHLPLS